MTDRKISELGEVTTPLSTDVLAIVNGGDTKKVTLANALLGSYVFTAASVLSLNDGTSADAISDLQVLLDGNIYHVNEVAGIPGFDLTLTFVGISNISSIAVRFYYVGGATHGCRVQVYNKTTTVWDTFLTAVGNGVDHSLYTLFLLDDTDYIDAGQVLIRFYHTETGTASHDLYVDYVGVESV